MFSVQSAVIDHAALSPLEVTLKNKVGLPCLLPRLLPRLPTLPVCSQGVLNALVVCLLHNTLLELKDSHPLGNDGVHQWLTELEKSRQLTKLLKGGSQKSRQLTKLLKGGLQSSEHVYQHSNQHQGGGASSELTKLLKGGSQKSRQLTKLLKGGLQSSEHVYQHSTQGRASSEYHMTNDEPIKHSTMNCTIFFHLTVAQVLYLLS